MSFGDRSRMPWALDADAAEPLFRQAVELGVTFWDTANIYGHGSSEQIVGKAIQQYTSREQVVLATKVFSPMHDGPGGGLSRKAVLEQVDARCAAWAPTTSTCCRSTASTPTPRSRRRWRRCTTS